MLDENPDTTNDQFVVSLFLKEYNSPERPEQGGRALPGRPYGFRRGATQEDSSSSEEGIQRQKPLESIANTFQKEGNIGIPIELRQFLLMLGNAIPHHTHIDAASDSLKIVKIPRASGWGTQLSLWESEPPTTDVGQAHTDLSAMRRSHIRQILEQSDIINQWGVGEAFQPRSWETESPTATVDLDHPDKSVVLDGISAQLDAVVRWREDWDGDEPEPEKPSAKAIDRAKQVVSQLLGAVISKGKPLHTPVISYDYDGYITMVWRNGKHELYLEITEDEIEYTKVWGINIDSEMDAGVPSKDNYLTLWEWLLDG